MWYQQLIMYMLIAAAIMAVVPLFGYIQGKIIEGLFGMVKKLIKSYEATYFIFNIATFVGTIHHELAHALLGFLTGAKIEKIVLFHPHGDTLGYVESRPRGGLIMRSIQQTVISIAPVLLGAINLCLLGYWIYVGELPVIGVIVIVYCMISIWLHMTMSHADFKVFWKGVPVVYLLMLAVVALVCQVRGIDVLAFWN